MISLLSSSSFALELPKVVDAKNCDFVGFVRLMCGLLLCCRYEFVTGSGVHAVMAAAASKGQVYVAGGTAPSAQWQASAPALRQAVQSFKLN